MSYPYDVKVDGQGFQFVCEFGNSRIQVFDARGQPVEILGGPGAAPGQFSNPWGVALDSKGNLYVADSMNHRVQKFFRREAPRAQRKPAGGGRLLVVGRPLLRTPWDVRHITCAAEYFHLTLTLSLRERELTE
jgi:sugar lactone lactonase YvrE